MTKEKGSPIRHKTLASFKEAHAKELDRQYLERYPNGKFVIQYLGDTIRLNWVPQRQTSHAARHAISVKYYPKDKQLGEQYEDFPIQRRIPKGTCEILHGAYQASSFGKVFNYNNFTSFHSSCLRKGLPEGLVSAFQDRYLDRSKEGFTI